MNILKRVEGRIGQDVTLLTKGGHTASGEVERIDSDGEIILKSNSSGGLRQFIKAEQVEILVVLDK